MKKLLTAVILLASTSAFAQLSQGNLFLTGTAGISNSSGEFDDGTSTTELDNIKNSRFGVGAGYMLSDQFAVIGGFTMTSTVVEDPTDNTESRTKGNSFFVGARRYSSIGNHLYLFGELAVGAFGSQSETETPTATLKGDKVSGFFTTLSPGLTFFPTETHRIALDVTVGSLGYTSRTVTDRSTDPAEESSRNTFDFGIDLTSVTFGIQVFFNAGGNSSN
ncbi:outer membrane beta-barrel protein [Luteibaculum oceani]|uniref:Porin family protein n=1 Tax=Luteibaculum oceani TaxID=1294296 RepID=A0A5C6VIW1_9FLAO|nr:outer membrane beta-barrel protein [Luteibaculum oceani]TXC85393.1 porin family protein [Luteibaculum oceani]